MVTAIVCYCLTLPPLYNPYYIIFITIVIIIFLTIDSPCPLPWNKQCVDSWNPGNPASPPPKVKLFYELFFLLDTICNVGKLNIQQLKWSFQYNRFSIPWFSSVTICFYLIISVMHGCYRRFFLHMGVFPLGCAVGSSPPKYLNLGPQPCVECLDH